MHHNFLAERHLLFMKSVHVVQGNSGNLLSQIKCSNNGKKNPYFSCKSSKREVFHVTFAGLLKSFLCRFYTGLLPWKKTIVL